MLDGRFDPDFFRALAAEQVSVSDRLPGDVLAFDPVIPRICLPIAGLVAMICMCSLA